MVRIAVLDDSKLMRNLIVRILTQAGHEAEPWEESSLSGLQQRLQASPPDLVVTDYQMPGCNGLTVARLAHAHRADLPVLLVTATHDPVVEEALRKQQPMGLLHKPVQEQELLAAVTRMLG
jgi:CheY-like chemotaxis protein